MNLSRRNDHEKSDNNEKSWWERNKKKVLIIGGIAVAVGISVEAFKNKHNKYI